MGMIKEIFESIKECPYCKSEKIQAVVTRNAVFYKDKDEYWEDEGVIILREDETAFECMDCGKEI